MIQRHPVGSYFGLAFTIAWAGSFLAVGPKFIRGETMQFSDELYIFLPMMAAPALAAITLTGIVDGRSGLRDLFSRMRRWRVGANWYAALLIFPVLILAVLLALATLISPDFAPIFFPAGILIGLFTWWKARAARRGSPASRKGSPRHRGDAVFPDPSACGLGSGRGITS